MQESIHFLILDSYPKKSRDQFETVGMTPAGQLYANLLVRHMPNAKYDILYSSDPGVVMPDEKRLSNYDGILWPGCNLTVYHDDDERVIKLVELVRLGYRLGIPQFGSCWAAQIAVYAAGGKIAPNPRGREMGVARKIYLTDAGRTHPMYKGKPPVFDGFISHDDEITELPEGGLHLASNDFTNVQAVAIHHENGEFWATQYHPEYDLHEVARLIVAREELLTREGYFQNHEDMLEYVQKLETIASDPSRKDLRWRLAIDDDLLKDDIRQLEFVNWLQNQAIPRSQKRKNTNDD